MLTKEDINLMPPAAKQERQRRQYSRQLARIYRRLIVAILFLYVATGAAGAIAWQKKQSVAGSVKASEVQENLTQEVDRVNQLVRALQQRIQSQTVWSPALQDILKVTPASIRIEGLTSGMAPPSLELAGISDSRAAVITFQSQLEKLPNVAQVEAPLKNFALGPDGKFSLKVIYHEPDKK